MQVICLSYWQIVFIFDYLKTDWLTTAIYKRSFNLFVESKTPKQIKMRMMNEKFSISMMIIKDSNCEKIQIDVCWQ